ncbi:hypothetical protein K2Q16_02950 [Patescibacteria group bacterium]|nr:hypothetical protein [Patescibacteria group bacterium]
MKFIVLGLLSLLAFPAMAAEYFFLKPQVQYEVLSLGSDPTTEREYYGELIEDPVMYELVSPETFTLSAHLEQPLGTEPAPLSLLVVRVLEDGRVEKVVRQAARDTVWIERSDRLLGVSWWGGEPYQAELAAGTYRIEVSSPVNQGKYRLTVGDRERASGYVATWKRLLAVNDFLGRSIFSLMTSYFVLAHLFVLAGLWLGWRYGRPWWSRRQQHVANLTHG